MVKFKRIWRVARCSILFLLLLIITNCMPKFVLGPTPEPVTLKFAYRKQSVNLQPLIAAFQEKNPNIKIELVDVPDIGSDSTLLRTLTFDIARMDRSGLILATAGRMRALDDLMMDDWNAIRSDFFKGSWEALSAEGQQWAVPAAVDTFVVYVNIDHLKALKLNLPSPNWTVNDFVELATRMNHPAGLPYAPSSSLIGYCTTPDNPLDAIGFVYLHGGRIVDSLEKANQITLIDPRTVEAVQWYVDLYTRHAIAPDPEFVRTRFPQGGVFEAALRGFCGVWVGAYSNRGGLDSGHKWTLGWAMLPLPRDRADFNVADIEGYYITRECKHPREAMKLIRFLSDRWEAAGFGMPPRRSLLESAAYAKEVGENTAIVARGLLSDRMIPIPYKPGASLECAVGSLIQITKRAIAENRPVEEMLADAQKRCQALKKP